MIKAIPSKYKFSCRPHCNVLKPTQFAGLPKDPVDAQETFRPLYSSKYHNSDHKVQILDVGCGYGALLPKLSVSFPEQLIMGIEIRLPVSLYVDELINQMREQEDICHNVAVYRANFMKHASRLFFKNQLSKIFILYPDPNVKKGAFRRRILNSFLLTEYAFVLKPGGFLYLACDLEDTFRYGMQQMETHTLFERVPEADLVNDPVYWSLNEVTADAKRAVRKGSGAFKVVFKRVEKLQPTF
ncbi:hypothetical protein P9112_009065 [Eukaryota sp. TZLM1-RC]